MMMHRQVFWTYSINYRVLRKICVFFTIHCNPSLAYVHRCKRPSKLPTQCECTVTPIGWEFFVQPSAGEGEVVNFREFLKKKHNIQLTPCICDYQYAINRVYSLIIQPSIDQLDSHLINSLYHPSVKNYILCIRYKIK